jgi:CDP-glucose 4,6-dehydratase
VTTESRTWIRQPVLVTGATGMVGSALCADLVARGATVVVLVLDDDPQSELRRSGTWNRVHVVDGALEDRATIERAVVVHDVSTIFHLGAQTLVGAARRDPVGTFDSNIRGTWNILDVARRHPELVGAVVVASSDKAYGTSRDLPYLESHRMDGVQPYEVSKSCADLIARSYAETYGVPVQIARCGNIFGPGDLNWSRLVPGTIRSLLQGDQPVLRSDGTLVRDYLYVADAISGYMSLADAAAGQRGPDIAYNFSDEHPMSVLDMYAAICEAAGKPDTEPSIERQAKDEIPSQYLDSSLVREKLGWEPAVGLRDGLRSTIEWYTELFGVEPHRFVR